MPGDQSKLLVPSAANLQQQKPDDERQEYRGPASQDHARLDSISFAQHATTMFFPHFVGDACSRQADEDGVAKRQRTVQPE
jgi:hypothetical protein